MTKRQKEILVLLCDGRKWRESEIRSGFSFLQRMYLDGWIDGGMIGLGNRPEQRLWWITPGGRAALTQPPEDGA